MHYRNDEYEYHYKTPKSYRAFMLVGIVIAGALVGLVVGLVTMSIEDEKDLYWEKLSDSERVELCVDYGSMGEEEMRELLEVFGTMSEEQELEFERTIEAAKEHC